MIPTLFPGDEVDLLPVNKEPTLGAIYLYQSSSCLIVHRLVKIIEHPSRLYITKGDNNIDSDPPILRNQILAEVKPLNMRINSQRVIIELMLLSFHKKSGSINLEEFNDLDWQLILETAKNAGLNSRINEILNPLNISNIPENIQNSFTTARIIAIHRNLSLFDEYQKIRDTLESKNISSQPIKGIWILQQAELHGLSRITSDIDLLIEQDKIESTINILREMGYKQDPSRSRFDSKLNFDTAHHLKPFRKKSISVELHFRAFPGSADEFNKNLILNSSLRDHFSLILLHFIRHLSNGDPQIKWLADLLRIYPFISEPDLAIIERQILPYDQNKLAKKLLSLLAAWVKHEFPGKLSHEFQSLISVASCQSKSVLREKIKRFLKTKNRLKRITAILLPRSEYLRFIYPSMARFPLIIIYVISWYDLWRKLE